MRSIIACICVMLFAQTATAHNNCSGTGKAARKTTIATPEENDYDVKGLKFDIELSNLNTAVSGHVITYARVSNVAGMSVYAFELDASITIDSFKFNNLLATVQSNGAIRKVTLGSTLAQNTNFTAQVYYHGTPASGSGQFFTGGLNHVKLASGTHLMYSISDPDFTDDWWPCKQSLGDKIDSVAMWVTVDDTLKVGSNGLLKNVTAMPGSKARYEWKTIYPIEYYLISVAVAPYLVDSYYMHFTDGSGDSMLIQNFVHDSLTYKNTAYKTALDSTGHIVDHFSKLFGKYPFYREKYGHCLSALNGGMEHQTMTTLGMPTTTLISHELSHQWWGDHVTYGKWEDIWLSEGFATYSEQLFLEHFWSPQYAAGVRTSVFNTVMSASGGSVWVDDTTNVNRVFDSRLTYSKGASVAHMLRYMAPHDSLFFKGLRAYQQQYAFGTAVTADLQTIMQQTYGISLDSFFRQWVYGQGFPTYNVKWYQSGTQVHVQLNQTTSHTSVPLFNIPVEILLKSATGDTLVKVNVDKANPHYIFYWGKEITTITVDPNNHIVNRSGTTAKDASLLRINEHKIPELVIYPNPATNGWNVKNVPVGSVLVLRDISGKQLWTDTARQDNYISAEKFASGTYLLEMNAEGKKSVYYKLVK